MSRKAQWALVVAAVLTAVVSLGASGSDTSPPDTSIDKGPKGTVEETSATFAFSADESGATFECSKEGRPYVPCTSPRTYYGYEDGDHSFAVRAIDAAGNVDPTPATRHWTVRQPAPTTTTTEPATTSTTAPETSTTTAPVVTAPVTVSSPPPSALPATASTTREKANRIQPATSSSTSTTAATAARENPAPAIVLPPPPPGSAAAETPTLSGESLAVAEGDQPQPRISLGVIGVGLILVLVGVFGLWWTRPRYDPA